ncbi:histidine phosphatase family protein [Microvirga tunisiensis]|uniref:Histidine phosphatase family protein n=1 Tax=Pannonibacter tanglangensis TaxID=2750084 RepID=A0A7X5JB17_9HYPH|nr:histidine phosphatase family protein [Pannonibacter sp. XCT-53]NBN79965.1 histidine phosphatase family protein [Pannonibacter sp. XCT-53]
MPLSRRAVLALSLAPALAALAGPGPAPVRAAPAHPWVPQLKDGTVVGLLRHALAPGTGDPAGFRLGDCSTQRNLSAEGRAQAQAIGAALRGLGLDGARVYSSQWCRCLDTARLLALGPVEELPALNSFFADRDREGEQTRALEDWLAGQTAAGPLILVTHQVNITALTGIVPASGELVLATRLRTSAPRLVARATLG